MRRKLTTVVGIVMLVAVLSGCATWRTRVTTIGEYDPGKELDYDSAKIGDVDDPERAKQMAQDDFEKRVLTAFTSTECCAPGKDGPNPNMPVGGYSHRDTPVSKDGDCEMFWDVREIKSR